MKKLLPVLLLGSIALTACAAPYPYDYYDDDYHTDRYEQRYDRYDDRYDDHYDDRYERDYDRNDDYRYRDGKYYDDDYIEHQIYSDPSFEQKRAQVMRILERRGYQVHEIEADDRRGRPVLKAEAFKNGREYDIVFSWPDLRIISEHIDY
ncbi:PepSY domain-containing protein [Neisseria sicca]